MLQTSFYPLTQFQTEYVCIHEKNDMKVQHYHDVYEIYLQTAGERTLFLKDVCYTLRPGDLYILSPFEIHYTQSAGSGHYERYLMYLPASVLSPILTENETKALLGRLESCVLHPTPEQAASIRGGLKEAETCTQKKGFLANKLLASCILRLVMQITDLLVDANCCDVLPGEYIPEEIVSVIHYINRHYQDQLTLEQAAALSHMSKYHFCRTFHSSTGATFLEYLYNIRLTKAHQMLTGTSLPISEVAARCGFSSTAHLTRIFRQNYGISPGAFRREAGHAVSGNSSDAAPIPSPDEDHT